MFFIVLGIDILGLGLLYSVPQGEHKNIVLVKKAMLCHTGRIFRLAGEQASVLRDFLRGHRRDGEIREVFGGGNGVRRSLRRQN